MAVNTALIQLRAPTGSWPDRLPEVALAICALSATVGGWLGCRPLLAHSLTRRLVLLGFPAAIISMLGILISDAAFNTTNSTFLRNVGLVVVGAAFPVFAATVALLGRAFQRRGRQAELVLVAGALGHTLVHSLSLTAQRTEGIWLAIALSSGAIFVAAQLRSSQHLGTAVEPSVHDLRVRVWPAAVFGIAAVLAWVFARSIGTDADRTELTALVVGALVAAAFASRELRGPRKPLVVPFGPTDRAIHQVPQQLLSGSVRLVGRPVHRVADGSIAGIEAEPSWSTGAAPSIPLARAAHAAGLGGWLQHVTLNSAQAHLPAVLLNLSGDDPFLSVPFDPSHHDRPATEDDLDGLLLRTETSATELVPWQNRGAMVQAISSTSSGDAIADVVPVEPGASVPRVAMGLVRGRRERPEHVVPGGGAMFVIDESVQPINLAAILSPIDTSDSGAVGPSRVRDSGQVDVDGHRSSEGVTDR